MIEQVSFHADGSINVKTDLKYNSERNLEEMAIGSSSEKAPKRIAYKYDDENLRKKAVSYDQNGGVIIEMKYIYNDQGFLSEMYMFSPDKTINTIVMYTYSNDSGKG